MGNYVEQTVLYALCALIFILSSRKFLDFKVIQVFIQTVQMSRK